MPSTPVTVTAAELRLLRDAERELKAILAEREAIKGELGVMTVQRDLLLEQLKAFQRKLFAAKSEVRVLQFDNPSEIRLYISAMCFSPFSSL